MLRRVAPEDPMMMSGESYQRRALSGPWSVTRNRPATGKTTDPHGDALHLTQTFRRLDATSIAYTVTIDDPKTYTKPWTNERTFRLNSGPLMEYSCEENNKGACGTDGSKAGRRPG